MVPSGSSNGSNQPVVSLGSKSCGISNLGLHSWVGIIKRQQDWDKGRCKWIETYWHMHKNYHKDLKIPCDPQLSPQLRWPCHFAFQIRDNQRVYPVGIAIEPIHPTLSGLWWRHRGEAMASEMPTQYQAWHETWAQGRTKSCSDWQIVDSCLQSQMDPKNERIDIIFWFFSLFLYFSTSTLMSVHIFILFLALVACQTCPPRAPHLHVLWSHETSSNPNAPVVGRTDEPTHGPTSKFHLRSLYVLVPALRLPIGEGTVSRVGLE